jgi:glycosyltransferase involved in cell wall biosynthesis
LNVHFKEPPAAPTVSVIIPAYETVEFLGQAVESVLSQDVPLGDIEVVVVDDGSTQDIRSVLAPFDARVRYVRQENTGPAQARNCGVAASRGLFVAFLDSDDYWLPGRLRRMVEIARAERPALVTTDFYYEAGGIRAAESRFAETGVLDFFDLPAYDQYLRALEGAFFSYMTLMERSVFDRLGGFNPRLHFGEDYDLSLRCLASAIPVRAVKEPLAVYRYLRPGASTTRWSAERFRSLIEVLEPHRAHVPSHRWRHLQDQFTYLRFREALERRAVLDAVVTGTQLATRPRFCIGVLRSRVSSLRGG